MFDLSLAEMAFIILVAVVFIGPTELPVVLRAMARFIKQMKALGAEIRATFDDIAKDSPLSEIKDEIEGDVGYIRDLEGKVQKTYSLDDFMRPIQAPDPVPDAADEKKP